MRCWFNGWDYWDLDYVRDEIDFGESYTGDTEFSHMLWIGPYTFTWYT